MIFYPKLNIFILTYIRTTDGVFEPYVRKGKTFDSGND